MELKQKSLFDILCKAEQPKMFGQNKTCNEEWIKILLWN